VWAKEIWPPSSPDCKPLDFSVWDVTELKVNAVARNNTEDLNKKMKEVMGFFDKDIVARTCRRFCSWIEAVVADYSNLIKYVSSQYISLLYFFTSIKSDHFQLCYVLFYGTFLNSGNIAATLYSIAWHQIQRCRLDSPPYSIAWHQIQRCRLNSSTYSIA
jgi:hypothetical protein